MKKRTLEVLLIVFYFLAIAPALLITIFTYPIWGYNALSELHNFTEKHTNL